MPGDPGHLAVGVEERLGDQRPDVRVRTSPASRSLARCWETSRWSPARKVFADALTAVPLAIAFSLGRRAATRRFAYGYGRAEDLAGIVIVVIIAGSAAFAGYEAIKRLIDPQDVQALGWVAAAGVIGFLGNEWVARYRIRAGREIGSAALVADGLHARTDGFTSLAVLLGAGGSALGFPLADPIVGLLITVAICFVLKDAAREIYHRLMDAVDPRLVDRAEHILAHVPGVLGAGSVRPPSTPTPTAPTTTTPSSPPTVNPRLPRGSRLGPC